MCSYVTASLAGLKSLHHPLPARQVNEDAISWDGRTIPLTLADAVDSGTARRVAVCDGHGAYQCSHSAIGARCFGVLWTSFPDVPFPRILNGWATKCLNSGVIAHANANRQHLLSYGATFAGYDAHTNDLLAVGDVAAAVVQDGVARWLRAPAPPDTPTASLAHRSAADASPQPVGPCDRLVIMSDGLATGFDHQLDLLLEWLPAIIAWLDAAPLERHPLLAEALRHTLVSTDGRPLSYDDVSLAIITPGVDP